MTILARFKNTQVEILDAYESGGVKLATVKAIEGAPFVGGDKWPVYTAYTIAPAAELSEITPSHDNQPNTPTLLDLALAAARPAWYSGESVWIWKNGKGSAFLKHFGGGVVALCLTGFTPSLPVFVLDPAQGWQPARNVGVEYQVWAAKAREALR